MKMIYTNELGDITRAQKEQRRAVFYSMYALRSLPRTYLVDDPWDVAHHETKLFRRGELLAGPRVGQQRLAFLVRGYHLCARGERSSL